MKFLIGYIEHGPKEIHNLAVTKRYHEVFDCDVECHKCGKNQKIKVRQYIGQCELCGLWVIGPLLEL